MIAPVGMAVNRVATMPIALSEIAMSDMAWVTGVAQTARGAVTPHSDARRPTTTSTSANNDIHIGQQRHQYRPMRMDIHNHHAAKRGSKIQSNAGNNCGQRPARCSNSVGVAFPQPRVAGEARYPG